MIANSSPPSVPSGIHLNLGCGAKVWPGFVNIDFPGNWSGKKPDIECDIRKLELPNEYADSVWSIHVVEHFYRHEILNILIEWRRVLKTGGVIVIEVPSFDMVKSVMNKITPDNKNWGQAVMWRLYGNPAYNDPNMVHKWCYSAQELKELLRTAGFTDVKAGPPEYHHPQLDMRVMGVK